MASLYKKVINGKPYWYLREMAWVGGKPKMVSERYLGTAADIEALLEAREQAARPARTRHLSFGAVAAAWTMIQRLGVVEIIDEVVGSRRGDAAASVGTYLALAALNRLVDPCSKRRLADWWRTTAADRFVKVPAAALDHRRFWDAMHAVDLAALAEIEHRIAVAAVNNFDLDTSALALDMTNFATYIDSTNPAAPIAQRGRAKQKRADLRLVGLGLVVTRDGGVPLVSHAYPGNRPDVTQFTQIIDLLLARHRAVAETTNTDTTSTDTTSTDTGTQSGTESGTATGSEVTPEITVVFDAGQNSQANFTHLAAAGLGFVGSVPPSDCPDLLARPAGERHTVDPDRFPGVSALQARRQLYGAERRVVLTHSVSLHDAQARGFAQTLAQASAKLTDLAEALARGRTRRPRATVETEIHQITKDPWVRRVVDWHLSGQHPHELRLSFQLDDTARTALEDEVFGKRVLITNREHWTITEVVAGYRSQSEAESSFRQLKDPHVVSFSPMHHWTEHNIRVHTFTCVLALQLAHLMRRLAAHHGHQLSVRELLDTLAGIEETVLIYPSTGGRPKARRMLTETSPTQDQLTEIFDLDRWAPSS